MDFLGVTTLTETGLTSKSQSPALRINVLIFSMMAFIKLPSLARPVASLGLRAGVGAFMARTEGFTASRVRFLDGHLRVSEADDLDLRPGLDIHRRLLGSTRGAEGFVERYFPTFIGSHK